MDGDAPSVLTSPSRRAPSVLRALIAAALTIAIIFLPALTAQVSYRQTGEPPERDLVRGAMTAAAGMAALAWLLFGLIRVVGKLNFMAAASTRGGGGFTLDDPTLIQAILARHDMACPCCGYNLRGLPAGPCPECREPISLTLIGADPLRPLLWLTRLAVGTYFLFVVLAVLSIIRARRMWPMFSWSLPPGVSATAYKAGLLIHPLVVFAGFIILIVLLAAWLNAEAGRPRALARWRVLNITIALLTLATASEILTWILLS